MPSPISIRLVPRLEQSPRTIAFVQTMPGKCALLAGFSLLLFLVGTEFWYFISVILALFTFFPAHRRLVLLGATGSFLFFGLTPFYTEIINNLLLAADIEPISANSLMIPAFVFPVLLFCFLLIHLVGHSRYASMIKRPVASLVIFYLGILAIASYAPLPPIITSFLWIFALILGRYFWFLCYSLHECKAPRPTAFGWQLGHYLPFWNTGNIPYPKGAAYLKQIESKNAEELAICQLKAVKLLIWAGWLSLFIFIINVTIYGYDQLYYGQLQFKSQFGNLSVFLNGHHLSDLGSLPFQSSLPPYEMALELAASGNPLSWHQNWLVIIVSFLSDLLQVAWTSHIAIAVIRMCGYKALRNTYKPLYSKSIAEFWNRYYYYYKELLVEFFFYPVFFRHFKKNPRLRTYAATMSAAFFGNFIYHFFRDISYIIDLGLIQAFSSFYTFLFFTFFLGNAIFISQMYQEKRRHQPNGPLRNFLAPFWVVGFYCLLTIFVDFRRESIMDNVAFLFSLFNVTLGI